MKLMSNYQPKLMVIIAVFYLFCFGIRAAVVQPEIALLAAKNYLQETGLSKSVNTDDNQIYTYSSAGKLASLPNIYLQNEDPVLYYIQYSDGNFAVVSAEDNFYPILAYSNEGVTLVNDLPPAFYDWLDNYAAQICQVREAKTVNPENVELWQCLINNSYAGPNRNERSVEPLLTVMWNQNWPYNALCPADAQGPGGHVYAGCVATAMGMVMKYWDHPISGVGNESYYCPGYGYQNASFETTTYLWDQMPDAVGPVYLPVATLLYHCGVAVHMGYAVDGSGAQSTDAAVAFVDHFRYPNAQFVSKDAYTNTNWNNLMTAQIDNGTPVYYSGYSNEGGHAFVLDGYDTDTHFHFNFGWSGSGNGYFYTTNISGFTSGQGAIINIIPENYSINSIPVRLYADDSSAGDNFSLSVKTKPILGNWNVNHYDMMLYYDNANVEYTGYTLDGTLSQQGTIIIEEESPGVLTINWDNASTLKGGGTLVKLNFVARDAGDFLFDILSMHYNTTTVGNVSFAMITVGAPVENIADSQITLSNIMHLNYNTIGTTQINTTYLLPSWNITHYQMSCSYDPTKIEYTGFLTEGTISDGSIVNVDNSTLGTLLISCDSESALYGSGCLLKLQFCAIGNSSSISLTRITASDFYYNDIAIATVGSANVILSAYLANEDEVISPVQPHLEIYPNPFQEVANIKFTGLAKEAVKINIYNLKGQLVKKLMVNPEVKNEINWDATDFMGRKLADGIYFMQWNQGKESGTNKVLIIK